MTVLIIITILLFIACVLFMREFVNQKITIETLNQQLNLSDEEYIYLFKENIKISEELSTFKISQRIQNL